MKLEICKTCEYYMMIGSYCTNAAGEHDGDDVDEYYTCDDWEGWEVSKYARHA